MSRKLVRITTVPVSLEKLLEGQLRFMSNFYDVTAISSFDAELKKYGEKEGVKTYYVPLTRKITPLHDLICVYRVYRFLIREKPIIVHTHTPKAGVVGMVAARLATVPIRLHTVAGLPLLETTGWKRKLLNFVERITYSCATEVWPNSRGLKDIIINEGFCPTPKLKVLGEGSSNGIDVKHFSRNHFTVDQIEHARADLGISESETVFVFVGRIVKDKGINELIAAFVQLQKEHSDCTLILVGPYEDDLDPISIDSKEEINDHPKIISLGYQFDVRLYLAISHILVFPSYREGFPNVVMQAGAMGIPVIASDINGCNEIIIDGVNGLLVPSKNKKGLFLKMRELMQNDSLRNKLGANARDRIVKNYERSKMWDIILKEYERLEANL